MMDMHESQAAYWSAVCMQRVGQNPQAILDDPWVRMALSDAAEDKMSVGINGFLWRFADHSRLIVTSELVQASRR